MCVCEEETMIKKKMKKRGKKVEKRRKKEERGMIMKEGEKVQLFWSKDIFVFFLYFHSLSCRCVLRLQHYTNCCPEYCWWRRGTNNKQKKYRKRGGSKRMLFSFSSSSFLSFFFVVFLSFLFFFRFFLLLLCSSFKKVRLRKGEREREREREREDRRTEKRICSAKLTLNCTNCVCVQFTLGSRREVLEEQGEGRGKQSEIVKGRERGRERGKETW